MSPLSQLVGDSNPAPDYVHAPYCSLPLLLVPPPQLVGDSDPAPDYVRAIMEKTGGMPLYIEMIVSFFSHRTAGAGMQLGGDVADVVNSMSFQQVRPACLPACLYPAPLPPLGAPPSPIHPLDTPASRPPSPPIRSSLSAWTG